MDKRFLGILGAIVIIFVGIFALSQHSSKSGGSSGNGNAKPTNHVTGQGTSGVKLVEYGDYECPICGAYYPPFKQVIAKYSNDIYIQFSNLPLTSVHPNAFAGARAAEAAGMQNKYWQMHDLLYENQDPLGRSGWVASSSPLSFFDQFAKQIGLDINKFHQDYASDKVNNSINADLAAFLATPYANHNVNKEATPTFFLDGKYIDNTKLGVPSTTTPGTLDLNATVTNFSKVIDAEIASKTATKH